MATFAFRTILAPHILHDANVATVDDYLSGIVVAVQHWTEVGAFSVAGQSCGVVGRARQQDGRALGSLRDYDDGVQFHAVAHGDHQVALDVLEAVGDGLEVSRGFAREVWVICGGLSGRGLNQRQSAKQGRQ